MMEILILMAIGFFTLYKSKAPLPVTTKQIEPKPETTKPVVIPTEKKTPALESPAIKGMIGMGINLIGRETGTIPSNFSPGAEAVSVVATGLSGQSDFSNPYSSIAESTINSAFPVLGTVIGGFLEGILGKDPHGKWINTIIYDETTRTFKQGNFQLNPYVDPKTYYIKMIKAQIQETIELALLKEAYPKTKYLGEYVVNLVPQTENDLSGSVWSQDAQKVFIAKGLGYLSGGVYYEFGDELDPLIGYKPYMNTDERFFYEQVYMPFAKQTQYSSGEGWIGAESGAPTYVGFSA